VWDYAELFQEEQVVERGLRVTVRDSQGRPVDLVGTPFHIAGSTLPGPTMPPVLGEQTESVLRELLGLSPEELARLRSGAVI
jgi:formyl-CoA transferase